jgi:curved DNA-binding protein CbpA
MADGFDPYKTLQVDPEADPEVVQAAYRRLARKFHPDVAPGHEAAERMIAINTAWEVVGDPPTCRLRSRADRTTTARSGSGDPAGATPGSAPSERPFEADSTTASGAPRPRRADRPPHRPPDQVSRDWTSGRSSAGFAYDPGSMRTPDGRGAAGSPPGNPSGSTLNFGRYDGWSLGEIARVDLEYLEWLDRMPIGRPYRDEIDAILRRRGRRKSAAAEASDRRGLFRRR